MGFIYYNQLIIIVLVALNNIRFSTGSVNFTKTPSNEIVKVGDDVSIVWEYSVGDKSTEFARNSPIWYYYDQNGIKYTLASESKKESWKWQIHSNCPARLRPRLSKAGNATLVITNVTLEDSGRYECVLVKIVGDIKASMELTVVEPITTTTAPTTNGTTATDIKSTPTTKLTTTTVPPQPPTPKYVVPVIVICVIIVCIIIIVIIVCCCCPKYCSCCPEWCFCCDKYCSCCPVWCFCCGKCKENRDEKDGSVTMTNKVDREGNQNA